MNLRKQLAYILCGALLAGCLAGCGVSAAPRGGIPPQTAYTGAPVLSASAEGGERQNEPSEPFKIYESFGLTYDAAKDELQYRGKVVRWFEDYYPVADSSRAGRDFFNENGVVDVYAIRDLSSPVRAGDGSYDPGGILTGIREFSPEEFAARDISAIKNPGPMVAVAGDPPVPGALAEMAKEYEPFGVTYDAGRDRWYFNGERVRAFRDVLTSNGESLTGGKFQGAMRTFGDDGGVVDIQTVRDFSKPDKSGQGTLTGIEVLWREAA